MFRGTSLTLEYTGKFAKREGSSKLKKKICQHQDSVDILLCGRKSSFPCLLARPMLTRCRTGRPGGKARRYHRPLCGMGGAHMCQIPCPSHIKHIEAIPPALCDWWEVGSLANVTSPKSNNKAHILHMN